MIRRIRLWLAREETPHALGMTRLFVFGWPLVGLILHNPVELALLPPETWDPIPPLSWFLSEPLDTPLLQGLTLFFVVPAGLACVGYASAFSLPAAAILGMGLLGYENCFGEIHLSSMLPCLLMGILACSRAGEVISIDAWRARTAPTEPDSEYGWPLQLGALAFVIFMFSAGTSKLFGTWLSPDPDQFEYLFARSAVLAPLKEVSPAPALTLIPSGTIGAISGTLALVLELVAPVALSRRALFRVPIVFGLFCVQVFNAVFLDIHNHLPWLAGYAFFLPWNSILGFSDVAMLRMGIRPATRARLPIGRGMSRAVGSTFQHLAGPSQLSSGGSGPVVISVVRDAEETIESFLTHHEDLGVRHTVLLDNGSTDRTLEIAREHPRLTILRCDLPFGTHAKNMRTHLRRYFGESGWLLQLDSDELFDYPNSDTTSFADFLAYLESRNVNAVLANMLEMFGDSPLNEVPNPNEALISKYPFYDLSNLSEAALPKRRAGTNAALREYSGGIRRKIFPSASDRLYKYPLIRLDAKFPPERARIHRAGAGARVADVSAVIYHYQFTSTLKERARRAIKDRSHGHGSRKYEAFFERLQTDPELSIYALADRPVRWRHTHELIEKEFIWSSPDFDLWTHERPEEGL